MVALLDAHKGLSMFEKLDVPVLGVVENMSFFKCPSCGHDEEIFGSEAMDEFKKSVDLIWWREFHFRQR